MGMSGLSIGILWAYSASAGVILGLTGHNDFYDPHYLLAWAGIPVILYQCHLCDKAEGRRPWLS